MIIYNFYQTWASVCRGIGSDSLEMLIAGLAIASVIWLALFILQSVGLYTMAKKANLNNRWMAFVPFVNYIYIGKIVGNCTVFGRKVKRLGLYTMLAAILSVLLCVSTIASEFYLYSVAGRPILEETTDIPFWTGLTGTALGVFKYYDLSSYINSIAILCFEILLFMLFTDLYKKYYAKNYFLLSVLVLFVPVSRFIAVFALRNQKGIDYETYMREKREAFFRQQQEYRNMYNQQTSQQGGTFTWGQTQNPYERPQPKDEEPFSEFSSKKPDENAENGTNSDSHDDFFN